MDGDSRKGTGEPQAGRPHVPDYGIPQDEDGILPWSHAVQRLERSSNYWIGTATGDGTPHAVPVWGVWVDGALYLGGGPDTRWARNLAANPRVTVHLESGSDVVILEGEVGRIAEDREPLVTRIMDAYESKYDLRHPAPFWELRPRVAFAWTSFPGDATRWRL